MSKLNSKIIYIVALGVSLILQTAINGNWNQANAAEDFSFRSGFVIEEGGLVLPVPDPNNPQNFIGTSGDMHTITDGHLIGSFQTAIQNGPSLLDVLQGLVANGSAQVEPVNGNFNLPDGTIADTHSATLILSEEASKFGLPFVVVVFAEGNIDGSGTGRYQGRTGQSSLFLKFEFDPAGFKSEPPVLPIFHTGHFIFEFDKTN